MSRTSAKNLTVATVAAVLMTGTSAYANVSLYAPANSFRDNGNTWFGQFGQNKANACSGNGFGQGYDKGYYSTPVRETCPNGNAVIRMDRLS